MTEIKNPEKKSSRKPVSTVEKVLAATEYLEKNSDKMKGKGLVQ